MKRIFIPIIIAVLLLSASFGLAAMNHTENQHGSHSTCPFGIEIIDCSQIQDQFKFAVSHLSTFAGIFSATLTSNLFFALLAFSAFLFFAVLILDDDIGRFRLERPIFSKGFIEKANFSSQRQILSWFSLHENSPSS